MQLPWALRVPALLPQVLEEAPGSGVLNEALSQLLPQGLALNNCEPVGSWSKLSPLTPHTPSSTFRAEWPEASHHTRLRGMEDNKQRSQLGEEWGWWWLLVEG